MSGAGVRRRRALSIVDDEPQQSRQDAPL